MDTAAANVGFMMIANNLRSICNILILKVLKEYPGILVTVFLSIFGLPGAVLMHSVSRGIILPEFAGCGIISGKIRLILKAA
jgi:hypothetical protein